MSTPPIVPQESTKTQVDNGLDHAQAWLRTEIEKHDYLDVRFDREPVVLTSPVAIDLEYGNGHGGNLVLLRLCVDADTTRCERLTYQADSLARPKTLGGSAGRADVPTETLRSLLDAVRALSTASVSARPRDHLGSSSNDFFVLVRVCRAEVHDDRTWEFAGYSSSSEESQYVAINAVLDRARQMFEHILWKSVPTDELRRTHFADAFERNRELYRQRFHWWVMERSVEALGWFGDSTSLETVAWIRDNVRDLNARQRAKIRNVLDAPATYLDGPPREVPEE